MAATALAVESLSVQPCGTSGEAHVFTLVSTTNGYNDSVTHSGQQWPVLSVRRCDTVTVRLLNQDPSQPHGLAVALYANSGVFAGPGGKAQVNFQVNRTGEYKVYCTIPCSIHPYMQNGVLIVS